MKKIIFLSILSLILMPTIVGEKLGDTNDDGSIDIADVVYLFKNRNINIEKGDLNCDNSIDIADVVYLFKNYDTYRQPVVFAKTFKLDPMWNNGYCEVTDSKGYKFVLLKSGATDPGIPDSKVFNTPITNVATIFYAPIVSTADVLNDTASYNSIKGVPTAVLKYSPEITKRYNEGLVTDIGTSSTMNYEAVVNISPQIVFLGDWSAHDTMENKLNELGITVSRCFNYDEPTFLGKIEWVKFAGAFWGETQYNNAEDYFQKAWKEKNKLLRTTYNAKTYPKVLDFWKWSDTSTPSVPQAQNYRSKLISDFKNDYVFTDLPGTGTEKPDVETFMERASTADVVILRQTGTITTKAELLAKYPTSGFENFKAYQNNRFYVSKPDYYIGEARDPIGYMEDYAKMTHPELFSNGDSDLKYFVKVQ